MSLFSNIYIIDDDPIAVFGLKKILGKKFKNSSIHSFDNPSTALVELSKDTQSVDLIFLDMNLPVMDAWQFIEELNETFHKKIVLISSAFRATDLKKAKSNPFVIDALEKPIYDLALNAFIEKHFNSSILVFDKIKEQTLNDLEYQYNLLKISASELKKDIDAIENSLEQNNQNDSQLHAHKIKYAFRLLLNEDANQELIQLEQLIHSDYQSEMMKKSFVRIKTIVNQSIQEINNSLKNQQP